jgi:hypothetical protein
MSVARSTAMVRLITPCAGVALMTFISLMPYSVLAQTIEYNQHGTLITYPSGDVISVGRSGDARMDFPGGRTEYGTWKWVNGVLMVFLSNRTISLPMLSRRPAEKVSGYCILRGKVVPDRYCY